MKKIIFTGLLVVIQASFCLNIWSQDVSKDMAVRAALHYTNLHKADNYQSMERCAAAPQSCAMGFGSDTLMVEKVSLTGEAFMWLVPTTDGWYLISPTQKTTPVFAYYPTDIKPSFENFSPAARDLQAVIATEEISTHAHVPKIFFFLIVFFFDELFLLLLHPFLGFHKCD